MKTEDPNVKSKGSLGQDSLNLFGDVAVIGAAGALVGKAGGHVYRHFVPETPGSFGSNALAISIPTGYAVFRLSNPVFDKAAEWFTKRYPDMNNFIKVFGNSAKLSLQLGATYYITKGVANYFEEPLDFTPSESSILKTVGVGSGILTLAYVNRRQLANLAHYLWNEGDSKTGKAVEQAKKFGSASWDYAIEGGKNKLNALRKRLPGKKAPVNPPQSQLPADVKNAAPGESFVQVSSVTVGSPTSTRKQTWGEWFRGETPAIDSSTSSATETKKIT